MSSLSGGNQQKVVIARALESGARSLVLDNPTRGVDAGAKVEIYGLIRDLADDGVAIVLISDDLPELIGLSNRILVLRDGEPQAMSSTCRDGGLPEQQPDRGDGVMEASVAMPATSGLRRLRLAHAPEHGCRGWCRSWR